MSEVVTAAEAANPAGPSLAEEVVQLRRRVDVLEAEAQHWKQVVLWYASPEQWRVHCDDRGRDSFTFRYGEDGGWVAKQALKKWGPNNAG